MAATSASIPGGEEKVLHNGDTITNTQGALVLENLIGEFITEDGIEMMRKPFLFIGGWCLLVSVLVRRRDPIPRVTIRQTADALIAVIKRRQDVFRRRPRALLLGG